MIVGTFQRFAQPQQLWVFYGQIYCDNAGFGFLLIDFPIHLISSKCDQLQLRRRIKLKLL